MVLEYVDWELPESNDIDDKFIERNKRSRLRVVLYIFIVEAW